MNNTQKRRPAKMHALKQYIKDPNTIFITRDGTKVKIVDIDGDSDEFPLTANIIGTGAKIRLTSSGSYYLKDAVDEENNEKHGYDIVDYEKPTVFTVGEYVTRGGRKATVYCDLSEKFDLSFPLYGCIEGSGNVLKKWDKNGMNTPSNPDDSETLIGPWVEPPYTITVNGKEFHPVKDPKNGEKYYYIDLEKCFVIASKDLAMGYEGYEGYGTILANLNLVYRTDEEARAFLDEITKPNAEIKHGTE